MTAALFTSTSTDPRHDTASFQSRSGAPCHQVGSDEEPALLGIEAVADSAPALSEP
jgi:hypothetical protein